MDMRSSDLDLDCEDLTTSLVFRDWLYCFFQVHRVLQGTLALLDQQEFVECKVVPETLETPVRLAHKDRRTLISMDQRDRLVTLDSPEV